MLRFRKYLLLALIFSGGYVHAQPSEGLTVENSPLLLHLFGSSSNAFFDVISQPEKYRYQIIYTQIDRNKRGQASLKSHYFNFRKSDYLYPASLAKLPLSLLALQKLTTLQRKGVMPQTPVYFDSAWHCQKRSGPDPEQPSGSPSIDGYIRKMMVVSDNEGYNRTYEFLGYDYIHEELENHGLEKTRIIQRFEIPCDSLSYYNTNPVTFFSGGDTLYRQQAAFANARLRNPYGEVFMGKAYYDASGYLFPFPRAFVFNNFVPLDELQKVMFSIFTPEAIAKNDRWKTDAAYMELLKRYMGMWPSESKYPAYKLPDDYKKYFLKGIRTPENTPNIRIFNVVGRAYGVLADCAYIVDFKNNREFYLTSIMYCNEDDTLNDDRYEYETVGLPFMSELAKIIYNFELNRNPTHPTLPEELKMLFPESK
jgi:hypothetical protein